MFPRAKRLSRVAFGRVRTGKRVATEHFSLSIPPSGEGYAVVVSKSVAKSSVVRHKIKRRVIAVLKTLPLPSSLIVYARSGADKLSYQMTHGELRAVLKQVR